MLPVWLKNSQNSAIPLSLVQLGTCLNSSRSVNDPFVKNMDEILDNFVGGHGKYQIAITIATSLINEFANGIFLMHIFTAYAPKHRCRVPQCETINATKVSLTRHTIKVFWFLTEEIQYHDGLRSRELGQAPILLCAPNS